MKEKNRHSSDQHNLASTRHLTRILTYLSVTKEDSISNIASNALVPTNRIADAMLWLLNHKLVYICKSTRKHAQGTKFYSLSK